MGRTRLALAGVVVLAGCVAFASMKHEALGFAEVYESADGQYQLRIPHRTITRGNPHDLFDITRREYIWAHWIPLEKAVGQVRIANAEMHSCPMESSNPSSYGNRLPRGCSLSPTLRYKLSFKCQQDLISLECFSGNRMTLTVLTGWNGLPIPPLNHRARVLPSAEDSDANSLLEPVPSNNRMYPDARKSSARR
jgi:hypothetical protein